jgi:hypothetical protein
MQPVQPSPRCPSPTSGASIAQTIITLVNDALTIAETVPGLPPTTVAILGSVQLLLVVIGGFFNLSPAVANDAVALAHPGAAEMLQASALTQYNSTSDKRALGDSAQSRVRAWIAT